VLSAMQHEVGSCRRAFVSSLIKSIRAAVIGWTEQPGVTKAAANYIP
jgi:hypothetical protein